MICGRSNEMQIPPLRCGMTEMKGRLQDDKNCGDEFDPTNGRATSKEVKRCVSTRTARSGPVRQDKQFVFLKAGLKPQQTARLRIQSIQKTL
jgi:hypothetical protein